MKRIAQFEKVSYKQFENDVFDITSEFKKDEVKKMYDDISLPKRKTSSSAGYDFQMPYKKILSRGESCKIPTGIRVKMEENWVLNIFPRSSLGFKYRMQLDNTVGIIDSDYYNSLNEGHIIIKITNSSIEEKELVLEKGASFVQGVFLEYGITLDDEVTEKRIGGFGSTDK